MNAMLSRVAHLDPDYVKHHRRQQVTLGASVGAALVSLIVAVVVLSAGTPQTPCEENPGGHECQITKSKSDIHQSVRNACIRTLKTGYPCPRPGSRVAREHPGLGRNGGGVLRGASSEHSAFQNPEPGGGVSHQPPSTGHQESGPPSGGPSTGSPGHSGESHPPGNNSPESPSLPPQQTTPRQETTSPVVSEKANNGVVESVGPTAGGTVSEVTETACSTTAQLHVNCP